MAGESIHSYLIRTLLCLGEISTVKDLVGIVSLSGVLHPTPKLDYLRGNHFLDLREKTRSKLLLEHTPWGNRSQHVMAEINDYIFFGIEPENSKFFPKGRTQLRYCPECFREQIIKHGFAWFNIKWLFNINCKQHKKRLSHIRVFENQCCGEKLNILDNLRSALSGKCPACPSSKWEFAKDVFINPDSPQNYLLINRKYLPAF